jgi:hypothetical protein
VDHAFRTTLPGIATLALMVPGEAIRIRTGKTGGEAL